MVAEDSCGHEAFFLFPSGLRRMATRFWLLVEVEVVSHEQLALWFQLWLLQPPLEEELEKELGGWVSSR